MQNLTIFLKTTTIIIIEQTNNWLAVCRPEVLYRSVSAEILQPGQLWDPLCIPISLVLTSWSSSCYYLGQQSSLLNHTCEFLPRAALFSLGKTGMIMILFCCCWLYSLLGNQGQSKTKPPNGKPVKQRNQQMCDQWGQRLCFSCHFVFSLGESWHMLDTPSCVIILSFSFIFGQFFWQLVQFFSL